MKIVLTCALVACAAGIAQAGSSSNLRRALKHYDLEALGLAHLVEQFAHDNVLNATAFHPAASKFSRRQLEELIPLAANLAVLNQTAEHAAPADDLNKVEQQVPAESLVQPSADATTPVQQEQPAPEQPGPVLPDTPEDGTELKRKKHGKLLQKNSKMTYYWLAKEKDFKKSKLVTLKTCAGKKLASVPETFARSVRLEGSGELAGGRLINLGNCSCKGGYNCFMEIEPEHRYGINSYGDPLVPFVSIASNDLHVKNKPRKIYVPQFDGVDVPGSDLKHNGCFLVDDKSYSFGNRHLDIYVTNIKYYDIMNKQLRGLNRIDVYEGGNCELQTYL
ncbi:uncharacterized protein VTP21DRAFT_7189 [Calcarisporiella thermophila]|uniref:uncharacterized protein n=1 Tax=Calcarisporiella thermophila TaxID=911321 RepID=UPI0037445628